jgi:arginase family enzyme
LRPENLCLIGIRSYEAGESELLERLGVRVIHIDEVARRGLDATLDEAIGIASRGTAGFGLSIDLDAIDPGDAPGVGTPVDGGLCAAELVDALARRAGDSHLRALEIAEYNPVHDTDGRTADLALRLAATVLSEARSGPPVAERPRFAA